MDSRTPLTIDEMHSEILEIMKEIDRFCRENDIPYTISSGTLLGAVRHGGFIPWDDDADFFMLRKDFERFVSIYKSDKYQLIYNVENPDGYFFISGHAKLNNPDFYREANDGLGHPAVYVDIFPLEDVPEDPKLCHKRMHTIMHYHNRLYHRQKKDVHSMIKSYFHSLDWWRKKFLDVVHDGKYADSPMVAQCVITRNYRTVIRRDRFDTLKDIMFEGYPFLAFSDTHSYLTQVYGPDYMTPVEWTHNMVVYRKEDK